MSDVFKWCLVGDLQMPYHDKRAVALFFKAMKAFKPHAIDVVGDIDDQLEYSQFSADTTDEFFNQIKKQVRLDVEDGGVERPETDLEMARRLDPLPLVKANALAAREFYTQLRGNFKKADIHASLGNHDIRVFKYLNKKAPHLLDEVTPNTLWGLDDLGITWRHYDDPPLERFAGIHVHHGVTTTTTGMAVKADIENYNVSLARGHDHRGGVVFKSYPMTSQTLIGLATGHMCDPSAYGLRYTINPSWELGFGVGYVVDGKAIMQFVPIFQSEHGYSCVVDGKLITE